MVNKKIKKVLGVLAGTSTLLLPTLAASCGNDIAGDKVIVGVTFSRGREQWNALEQIIENYNNEKKNDKDYKVVELFNLGSGYDAGHNKIVQNLTDKSAETPSITFNYGATISKIVEYGRQFDFSDQETYGDYSIKRDIFEDRFTKFNDEIQGVKTGGNYSLPIFKSSIGFGVNGPIFKYVFKTIKDAGLKLDQKIIDTFKVDKNDWQSDIDNRIKKEFGDAKPKEEIKKLFGSQTEFKFDDIFEVFTEYIKFITNAIQMFNRPEKGNNIRKELSEVETGLLGIDDPSGSLNTVLFSWAEGKNEKMPMRVTTNSDGQVTVGFDSISDVKDETTKKEEEIFNLLKNAIKAGAVKIYGGGAYSSQDETKHLLGSNLGSTAGYKHNFVDDPKPYISFKIESSTVRYNVLSVPKEGKVKNGDYTNSIVKSTDNAGKYDYKSTDAKYDANITKLTKDSHAFFVRTDDDNKPKVLDLIQKDTSNNFEYLGEFEQNKIKYDLYKITKFENNKSYSEDKIKTDTPTSDDYLGKSELVSLIPFKKYDLNSKVKTAFIQGPNLYGIRKNKNLDLGAAKFVKYLSSNDVHKFVEKDNKGNIKKGKDGKPITREETNFEHISRVASYLVPFKGFAEKIKKSEDWKKILNDNAYLKIAFDVFTTEDIKIYEEPASVWSNAYRERFNSAYRAAFSSIRSQGGDPAFKTAIIDELEQEIGTFSN